MANLKIVLVGGGSFAWTPRLVGNILQNDFLNGSEVVLYDVNPETLALTYQLCQQYRELSGADVRIIQTTDQTEALSGADAVVVTITTGGLRAMAHDLEIPEKYGIYQMVGDTVGPGGLSRSLRNVPVFLNLARAMETHCPGGWMLNCSNPLSALTRVVDRETSVRTVGVCHGVPNVAKNFAQFFGVDIASCSYVNTGIDHCAWFTEFVVNGRPAMEQLKEMGVEDWLALDPEAAEQDGTFAGLSRLRCGIRVGLDLGALPAIGDRHLFEFLPGYLNDEDAMAKHGLVRTSVADREKGKVDAQKRLEELVKGTGELQLPDSSDDVAAWIAALYGGPPVEDNLNAPNIGQVPQLPEGAVVETRGVLDATGYRPLVSPMPEPIEAIVRPHAVREELTVDAALEGSFEKALSAMVSDPLVRNAEDARPLLEELVAANREFLPQFE
ncbi:MAG: hypothetical protein O7G87_15905 [bacterium]|nr:hypothetical protein [bacterium]